MAAVELLYLKVWSQKIIERQELNSEHLDNSLKEENISFIQPIRHRAVFKEMKPRQKPKKIGY